MRVLQHSRSGLAPGGEGAYMWSVLRRNTTRACSVRTENTTPQMRSPCCLAGKARKAPKGARMRPPNRPKSIPGRTGLLAVSAEQACLLTAVYANVALRGTMFGAGLGDTRLPCTAAAAAAVLSSTVVIYTPHTDHQFPQIMIFSSCYR